MGRAKTRRHRLWGGVVPQTVDELQSLIQRIGNATGGNFPIQSQHEGNCASDSIQIIMSFADRIGPTFAAKSIAVYAANPTLLDATYSSGRLTTQSSVEDLATAYLTNSVIRYLALLDEYQGRIAVAPAIGPGYRAQLLRSPSNRPPVDTEGQVASRGTLCSTIFALMIRKGMNLPGNVTDVLSGPNRNAMYGYTEAIYDPIITRVLASISPRFTIAYGRPPAESVVGIQVFCVSEENFFHTFALFRYGGHWFIGDNEVGVATPCVGVTTELLLQNQLSFTAVPVGGEYIDGVMEESPTFVRTYSLGGQRIATVQYTLIDRRGIPYTNATEARGAQTGMRRKYYLAPPGSGPDFGITRPPVAIPVAVPVAAPAAPAAPAAGMVAAKLFKLNANDTIVPTAADGLDVRVAAAPRGVTFAIQGGGRTGVFRQSFRGDAKVVAGPSDAVRGMLALPARGPGGSAWLIERFTTYILASPDFSQQEYIYPKQTGGAQTIEIQLNGGAWVPFSYDRGLGPFGLQSGAPDGTHSGYVRTLRSDSSTPVATSSIVQITRDPRVSNRFGILAGGRPTLFVATPLGNLELLVEGNRWLGVEAPLEGGRRKTRRRREKNTH